MLMKHRQPWQNRPIPIHPPAAGKITGVFGPLKVLVKIPQSDFSIELHFVQIGAGIVSRIDELISRACKEGGPKIKILKRILLKQGTRIDVEPFPHEKIHLDRAICMFDRGGVIRGPQGRSH